jgi:hypothetical protein
VPAIGGGADPDKPAETRPEPDRGLLRHAAPAVVICLLLISILAVAKPF